MKENLGIGELDRAFRTSAPEGLSYHHRKRRSLYPAETERNTRSVVWTARSALDVVT